MNINSTGSENKRLSKCSGLVVGGLKTQSKIGHLGSREAGAGNTWDGGGTTSEAAGRFSPFQSIKWYGGVQI